mmetsp:Transcript_31616/g.88639  ORF Transcript_31616/g.88639 Transcript_31616/m.88639 type:complete len:246 (+) Transcript_31616:290-1027(+)
MMRVKNTIMPIHVAASSDRDIMRSVVQSSSPSPLKSTEKSEKCVQFSNRIVSPDSDSTPGKHTGVLSHSSSSSRLLRTGGAYSSPSLDITKRGESERSEGARTHRTLYAGAASSPCTVVGSNRGNGLTNIASPSKVLSAPGSSSSMHARADERPIATHASAMLMPRLSSWLLTKPFGNLNTTLYLRTGEPNSKVSSSNSTPWSSFTANPDMPRHLKLSPGKPAEAPQRCMSSCVAALFAASTTST